MELEAGAEVIRTARLELVPLSSPFHAAILRGDLEAAAEAVGARVPRSLARDASPLSQLHLAGLAARAHGFDGFGRLIVLVSAGAGRLVIGCVGFHGPPDDRNRLEVSARIHPNHRGRGYGAEALSGLLDWATRRFGITRFVGAIQVQREPGDLEPIKIEMPRGGQLDDRVDGLGLHLERR
jgi:RimJ/RimL family protein N-acetyltransferase